MLINAPAAAAHRIPVRSTTRAAISVDVGKPIERDGAEDRLCTLAESVAAPISTAAIVATVVIKPQIVDAAKVPECGVTNASKGGIVVWRQTVLQSRQRSVD